MNVDTMATRPRRRRRRRARPLRDYVLLRPRRDLLGKTTTLSLEMDDEAIKRAEALGVAGGGTKWNPNTFRIGSSGKTADPTGFAFGEVIEVGPGNRSLSECRPMIKPGDVVGYSRFRVAHELTRGSARLEANTQDEDLIQFVHEHGLICRVDVGAMLIHPLMNWVLTERDAQAFQEALERELPLTDIELADGVSTNVHQRPDVHGGTRQAKPGAVVDSKIRMVVERVVDTGPGRWVKPIGLKTLKQHGGSWYNPSTAQEVYKEPVYEARRLAPVFEPNKVQRADVVAFLRCASSIPLYINGRHLSLTPWDEMICAWDEEDEATEA